MNLFDQYGIKEVADVTIYSIHKKEDGSGDVYYVPALYLDTLKVTTTEKTAENTWAQGGLGNSRLISWDYGKTINLTLEDALCTPASLGLCWGGILGADWKDARINHVSGIKNMDCATERISRMEKAFYPRNDTINATVSNLLPRDGKEDILEDQHGDPVYLQRSSVLDGTDIRGFGYVDGHPYKWNLEIETAVKSIALVPDRFFSIYGKSYPIKRRQTVGINQPSEFFKYEIIYLRGYDKYDDETPKARIIYHRQAEEGITTDNKCASDKDGLNKLDNYTDFPYLKIRVCYDGSVRVFLGQKDVDWDLERPAGAPDSAWWEVTDLVNTDQFRNVSLWLRFDSINALSYYLITKHENDIFNIGPKVIRYGLEDRISGGKLKPGIAAMTLKAQTVSDTASFITPTLKAGAKVLRRDHNINESHEDDKIIEIILNRDIILPKITIGLPQSNPETKYFYGVLDKDDALLKFLKERQNELHAGEGGSGNTNYLLSSIDYGEITFAIDDNIQIEMTESSEDGSKVSEATGKDYALQDPAWTEDTSGCTPCCKKDNLSRSIWAYVNPRTMQPYDDDYWFHQGEPYYKKSLTLSTKQSPLKAQKIYVEQGVFPGMYKIVCETYIRNRDTGDDERVQISLPLCKIKSDQTLTLQADGDPTTFNLDVEVATPRNGVPMEITFYEVEKEMKQGCSGGRIEKDGSTRIVAK